MIDVRCKGDVGRIACCSLNSVVKNKPLRTRKNHGKVKNTQNALVLILDTHYLILYSNHFLLHLIQALVGFADGADVGQGEDEVARGLL